MIFVTFGAPSWPKLGLLRCQKKRRLKRRLLQAPQAPFKAPIHSKCCIGGFRETGLTLVIVLRCDWPLCDLRFKSYEHFKIKMFLSVPAGPWWIFQPKSSEQSTENTPVDISPPNLRQCQYDHDQDEAQPVLYTNGFYPKWHSCESFGCQCFLYKISMFESKWLLPRVACVWIFRMPTFFWIKITRFAPKWLLPRVAFMWIFGMPSVL